MDWQGSSFASLSSLGRPFEFEYRMLFVEAVARKVVAKEEEVVVLFGFKTRLRV